MPEALDTLEEGVRLERAGLLDRALEVYRFIAETSSESDRVAAALTHEADVHRTRCDWDAALGAAHRAQQVARDSRLTERLAEAMIAEGNVLMSRGELGDATLVLDRVAAKTPDPRIRGIVLQNLGTIHAQMGQLQAAERAFSESIANFRQAGYQRGEAIALNNCGRLALDHGEPERAVPLLQESLRVGRNIEDLEVAAMASLNLASALCCGGELDVAQDLAMSALGYFAGCQNSWREIECLRLIGDINEKREDCVNAGRCYDLAVRLAKEIGADDEERALRQRLAALAPRLGNGTAGLEKVVS
jgi:tetratricopeptide (TPR) repeat protein